jgi:hypothetical protein
MFAHTGQNRIVPIRWAGLAGVKFTGGGHSSSLGAADSALIRKLTMNKYRRTKAKNKKVPELIVVLNT